MDLGPALEKAGYGVNTTSLMIFDDQRDQILHWAEVILKDKDAAKYVSGTAFHWYNNKPENAINLDKTHEIDPTKYILNTEASMGGFYKNDSHSSLGSWFTFENYANDIITVNKFFQFENFSFYSLSKVGL
jgi:glucosylceramidase